MVLARHDQPRVFVHLGAEPFTLHCWVADQGCCLGELAICGWLQGVASGLAGGGWFGRTQGLDLPPGVAAAQFGVGGDGQAPGSFGGVLPFLPGGYVLGEGLFSVLVVVAQGPVAGGSAAVTRSRYRSWRAAWVSADLARCIKMCTASLRQVGHPYRGERTGSCIACGPQAVIASIRFNRRNLVNNVTAARRSFAP